MNKIRVMYVEDDPDWQIGLRNYLSGYEEIDLFTCVSTIEECYAVLRDAPTDIVLMDIMLDNHEILGLDATLDISIEFPHVKIIMFSSLDTDDEIFYEAFMNGAYEYVYKHDVQHLPDTILSAIRNPTHKFGERLRKLVYERKKSLLSHGDRILLRLLLEGKTQSEISVELGISLAAVKKHIGRILKKFHWQYSSKKLADKCNKWGLLID